MHGRTLPNNLRPIEYVLFDSHDNWGESLRLDDTSVGALIEGLSIMKKKIHSVAAESC